jgi:hypothetical protein
VRLSRKKCLPAGGAGGVSTFALSTSQTFR